MKSNTHRRFITPLFALLACFCGRAFAAEPAVLIYGATPGGIAAAVSAAKGGQSVALVEPTDRLGGLLTCGLSFTDYHSFEALTGFFLDFAQRVEAHYRATFGADSEQVRACQRGTLGEPGVNLRVLEQMLADEPRIRVVKQHALAAVEMSAFTDGRRRIVAATFQPALHPPDAALRLSAEVFIDASYEGDLMAMAGESYHIGRESRAQYGEELAGNERGEADGQVQGYNFRFTTTRVESNKLMPAAPEGYRREDFAGVLPVFAAGKLTKVFASGRDAIYRAHSPLLPNGKADVNDTPHAPVRLSMPDINDAWPDGDAATRARLFREHLYYNVGLLYFLQNDDAVPAAIRADARQWGWCRDEFTATGGLPPQLYIREARRLVGQHVFTGRDTVQAPGDARTVRHADSIAMGDYGHNCHGTGRVGSRFAGRNVGEFYKFVPPYQIPYGVIVPQKTANLLVPVACSASHFGFGALRLEPIWCSLGQAAGWAAHLALKAQAPVQNVSVPALQRLLHADRSATIYLADVPPAGPHFAAAQWFALRGAFHGLADAEQPKPKHLFGQYCAAFPGHTAGLDQPLTPALAAKWSMLLPDGQSAPTNVATRGEWLQAAFQLEAKP